MFETCWKIHTKGGHQGCKPMLEESKKFYANPVQSSSFNERMQIDLIDFRTMPDCEFNWILNCHDHFTKC
ncbi:unnamed protein product [Brachionus calyciflorus]|uniref:Uncharacterized protein n=1 Tax=Brachionus calyciflorus TaxID=104777 RepID=A0A814B6P5_9BILA|nr:unnamed protein product [Brachionus calyciflorus]